MGSIFPCRLPFGNAGGLQILRCQGFEVKYYDVTLDALTLKPSDVCNVGVNQRGRTYTLIKPGLEKNMGRIFNIAIPISGLLISIGKTSREALISKEPTKFVVKISVNSRCNRVYQI